VNGGAVLRLAITADPYLPVPPTLYGGTERVIDLLVRGLVARGHEVTLLAHPDSDTPARLVPYGCPPHMGWPARITELAQVGGPLWRSRGRIDLVHSFGRLAALLPILPMRDLPKIQTYEREVPWTGVTRAARIAGSSLLFTGCSASLFRAAAAGEWRAIFNGVDVGRYTCQRAVAPDAPLMLLGRLDPIKGAHHAIAIARRAGRRLIIAGPPVTEGPDAGYFDSEIAPHVDGVRVEYIGSIDDAAKNRWLGGAAALLMPIEWEEPFGIVLAEALACGTAVLAYARGSVPEVVIPGVNGYVCRNVDDAVAAVRGLDAIDRARVRADCEARFGADVIVNAYEALYFEMAARGRMGAASCAVANA
jgi:glycosyltransferase involved in cell wall biosynthesis